MGSGNGTNGGNGAGKPIQFVKYHDPTDKPRVLDFEVQRWWGKLESFHDEIKRMEARGYTVEVLRTDAGGRPLSVRLVPPTARAN